MILFQLCTRLGYPHPDYLMEDLTGSQLLDWIKYTQYVGPLGVDRDDVMWGMVCTLIVNSNPNRKGAGAEITDFMPYYDEDNYFTDDELRQNLRAKLKASTNMAKATTKT